MIIHGVEPKVNTYEEIIFIKHTIFKSDILVLLTIDIVHKNPILILCKFAVCKYCIICLGKRNKSVGAFIDVRICHGKSPNVMALHSICIASGAITRFHLMTADDSAQNNIVTLFKGKNRIGIPVIGSGLTLALLCHKFSIFSIYRN